MTRMEEDDHEKPHLENTPEESCCQPVHTFLRKPYTQAGGGGGRLGQRMDRGKTPLGQESISIITELVESSW